MKYMGEEWCPMDDLPVNQWPIITGYICRKCGDNARRDPDDDRNWGCATCEESSHSVWLNFVTEKVVRRKDNDDEGRTRRE